MRSLILACAVIVVVSGIASTKLWRALRTERESAVALQTQLATAIAHTAEPSAPGSPAISLAEPATAARQATPPAGKQPPTVDATAAVRSYAAQRRERLQDPEYRRAELARIRASIPANNQGLVETLGLSQAEANGLFDLLAESQMNMRDESLLDIDRGAPSQKQAATRTQELTRQREEGIAALLGPAKYAQYQQFGEDAPGRSLATSMGNQLARAGQPMNAGQQQTLTKALAVEARRQREEVTALFGTINVQDAAAQVSIEQQLRKMEQESRRRLLAAAAPALSAQQLAVVRTEIEQQEALDRARERAIAARSAVQ